MAPKKSKYDTNPLDPDFVKNAEEVWGDPANDRDRPDRPDRPETPETTEVRGATREVASSANENARNNIYSEAPTRRYDNVPLDAPYRSMFVPPTYSQPAPYQPPPAPYPYVNQRPTSRPVDGIGISEKWAMVLPYVPLHLGIVAALVELFLVPRSETKVRFHAAQALALQIVILLIQSIFYSVSLVSGGSLGLNLFKVAATVFLLISMNRVAKGKPHHIAAVSEPARWLNERIRLNKS